MSGYSNPAIEKAISEHPCYNESAHHSFARMHIPVAPKCNIQCGYCNRKFDCCNESRPGVTSEVLSPRQASDKINYVKSKIENLRVIGIAGPGDPLANESTFESLKLIKEEHPELIPCVSTNGLALPENAERLFDLNVRFVTVTMNACDPSIGARVYSKVIFEGKCYSGTEGASILIEKQTAGIRRCVDLGMVVKINIVMIPGINTDHIPELVRYVKNLGAYTVNILPLIPVEGTEFEKLRAPTALERKKLMDLCSIDAKMMRHCRQCRADAIGLLGEDRSQEFVHIGGCTGASNGCGPVEKDIIIPTSRDKKHVAIASADGETVDSGFGNCERFMIFSLNNGEPEYVRDVRIDLNPSVAGSNHRKHIENVIESIDDCGTIVVKEIGPLPRKVLGNLGVDVIESQAEIKNVLKSLIRS